MNAEEIIGELRCLSENDEWVFAAETMAKAADIIESLQAQLAKENAEQKKQSRESKLSTKWVGFADGVMVELVR